MNKKNRIFLQILLCLFIGVGYYAYKYFKFPKITYQSFNELLTSESIKAVEYDKNSDYFIAFDKEDNQFKVPNPQTDDYKMILLEKGIDVRDNKSIFSIIYSNMSNIINIILICLMLFITKNQFQHIMSKKKKIDTIPKERLSDIVMPKSIKEEARIMIDYIKNPNKYKNVDIPNGILLYGPPGTGKTMFAKAIAGEANCSFFATSGSDFVELYVGNGANRVRKLFAEAKANKPSIIFIDEIDAIGMQRGDDNTERNQTINALLSELDGFEKRDGIMVIAATNQIEMLDKALLRSGRFGKHIAMPLPRTIEERKEIIHKNLLNKNHKIDLDSFAKVTWGCSGADIASIINTATMYAISQGKEFVDDAYLWQAYCRFLLKGNVKDGGAEIDEDIRIAAYHEAGHALIAKKIGYSVPIVTIASNSSGAGGYTIAVPIKEKEYYTREEMLSKVAMLYAGRIAEEIKGYSKTVGAGNDIKQATQILRKVCCVYGMHNYLLNYEELSAENEMILKEIESYSSKIYNDTKDYLTKNKDKVEKLADRLIVKKTITEQELGEILVEGLSI